jgi:DNA-binding transcriptional LysR family regulator
MDINRLRYFLAIVDAGGMSAAARLVRISPPALSKAMSVLEQELQHKIWGRKGRNLVLTDFGRNLIEPAREIVRKTEELINPTLLTRSQAGGPRIGSFEVFTTYFLGELASSTQFLSGCEVHELIPGEIEEALIERKVDLGITYIPIPRPGLHFEKVTQIKMGSYCSEAKHATWSREELLQIPFAVPISPVHGSPNRVRGLDGWPDDRLPRFRKYKITLLESALELCRRGFAAAYVPHFIVSLHNQRAAQNMRLIQLPHRIPGAETQDVYIVRREDGEENPLIREVARSLRRVCRLQ